MKRRQNRHSESVRQPLPDTEIQRNARHGKTVSDLPEPDDLPLTVLKKDIPETDLHDM